MLSTHYFAHLGFDWQLSLIKLLRLILLAHWTTKLPFLLAQKQKLLFLGSWTFVLAALSQCISYWFNIPMEHRLDNFSKIFIKTTAQFISNLSCLIFNSAFIDNSIERMCILNKWQAFIAWYLLRKQLFLKS